MHQASAIVRLVMATQLWIRASAVQCQSYFTFITTTFKAKPFSFGLNSILLLVLPVLLFLVGLLLRLLRREELDLSRPGMMRTMVDDGGSGSGP